MNVVTSPFPKWSGFPSSTFVSTFISPPCALTILAQTQTQSSPLPFCIAVKKGLKILATIFCEMPFPLSLTVMHTLFQQLSVGTERWKNYLWIFSLQYHILFLESSHKRSLDFLDPWSRRRMPMLFYEEWTIHCTSFSQDWYRCPKISDVKQNLKVFSGCWPFPLLVNNQISA